MRKVEIKVTYKTIMFDDIDREEMCDEVDSETPDMISVYDELNDAYYTARRENTEIIVEG